MPLVSTASWTARVRATGRRAQRSRQPVGRLAPVASVPGGIGSSGMTVASRSRACIAYASPDGTRRLSSSTRQTPEVSRTRSVPMTVARTALVGDERTARAQPRSRRPARSTETSPARTQLRGP